MGTATLTLPAKPAEREDESTCRWSTWVSAGRDRRLAKCNDDESQRKLEEITHNDVFCEVRSWTTTSSEGLLG